MTKIQRVGSFLSGLFIIIIGIITMLEPKSGLNMIGLIISLSMLAMGIRALRYYFTMARYMVDGRYSLYRGAIMLNLGVLTMTLTTVPPVYIIAYLVGVHAFAGGVSLLGAIDAIRMEATSWRIRLLTGIGNLVIAALCIYFGLFKGSEETVVYVYAAGLIYTGVLRMAAAFRRSAIVYIQ